MTVGEQRGKRNSAPAQGWALSTIEAITVLRTRAGLSERQLWLKAGMNYPYFHSRFQGHAPLTLNDVEQLCEVLQVSPFEVSKTAAALQAVASAGEGVEIR